MAVAEDTQEKAEIVQQVEGPPAQDSWVPTVIAEDLHIVYRVYGGAKGKGSATAALNRIVRRKPGGGSLREVHAVKGVSFTAYRGQAIGLMEQIEQLCGGFGEVA